MAIKILDIYGQNVASKRMGIECRINEIDSIIFVAKWIQIYGSNIEKRGIHVQKTNLFDVFDSIER